MPLNGINCVRGYTGPCFGEIKDKYKLVWDLFFLGYLQCDFMFAVVMFVVLVEIKCCRNVWSRCVLNVVVLGAYVQIIVRNLSYVKFPFKLVVMRRWR